MRFSDRPLGDLWCQAAAALVFQPPDVTKGPLSVLNEKMADSLADIVEKGLWTGERGESFLLASQNMIRADKLLFQGLGQSQDYEIQFLEDALRSVGIALDKMGVNDFSINIPVAEGLGAEYASHLEFSVRNLLKPFLDHHNNDPYFLLKVIFSVETDLMGDLTPVLDRLREHFTPLVDFSVIIDRGKQGPSAGER